MADGMPKLFERQWAKEECLQAIDDLITEKDSGWSMDESNAVWKQRDRVAKLFGLPEIYKGRTF